MKHLLFLCIVIQLIVLNAKSQITEIVLLNETEIERVKELVKISPEVKYFRDSIINEVKKTWKAKPQPVQVIHYEGLLPNHPDRMKTVESLADADRMVNLIYASYFSEIPGLPQKAKQLILAWATTYLPDGNPINENKLTAFFWGFQLFKNYFTSEEQKTVTNWLGKIAAAEQSRAQTPSNNWEAKRLKIIGTAGCILDDENLKSLAAEGFKKYIATAYFADGTSNDLQQRDALHYHIGGIIPCLSGFINLTKYDNRFDLYWFTSESGSSIEKSVEYVIPYATGEKQRKEWVNSKVELDRERAAAGVAEYQPGKLFEPQEAYSMLQWAVYFNPDWFPIFEKEDKPQYRSTWIGFLNSPLVRQNE